MGIAARGYSMYKSCAAIRLIISLLSNILRKIKNHYVDSYLSLLTRIKVGKPKKITIPEIRLFGGNISAPS